MANRRVLQIVGDPAGGIRKHVHDILNGLHNDFDFYYISSNQGDRQYQNEITELEQRISDHRCLDISKKPALSDLRNCLSIYRYIRRHNIDLVHGHGAKGGLYARICGKLAGCAVIYTPHGGVVHSMFSRIESWIYRLVERFLCHFTDLLLFESRYTASSFAAKFGCGSVHTRVNYNGIAWIEQSQAAPAPGRIEGQPLRIGYFGILRHEKGPHLALQAVQSLLAKGRAFEFHLYGNGPLRQSLEDEIEKSGLTDRIFLHGEVDDVYRTMQSLDFVLIPSLFESFGYVAVEAMMLKKSLIASNAGGLAEVVPAEYAFCYDSTSLQALEAVIEKALQSSTSELEQMREQAFDYARQ